MEELHKFVYGTVVCDGCACRRDSDDADDERLHDIDDLLGCRLEDIEWVQQSEDKWFCPECATNPSHRTHPGEGRVIAEKTTCSGLRCDHCGAAFESSEGFSWWEDFSYTEENARNEDWRDVGGKMLCPDCYRTCDAMEDEEEENYEDVYCSKCPHKDDCNEVVEREVPVISPECESAVKKIDESSRVSYKPCPFHVKNPVKGLNGKCNLPQGKKCPRVEAWEIEKEEVAKKNNEIQEWVKNRCNDEPTHLKN